MSYVNIILHISSFRTWDYDIVVFSSYARVSIGMLYFFMTIAIISVSYFIFTIYIVADMTVRGAVRHARTGSGLHHP